MTTLRSFSFALLLLLFGNSMIFAQETGSIRGKVRNIDNDRSIAGAKITVRSDGKSLRSALTDSDGEFKISGLAVGRYNVLVEKDGFSPGVLYNVEVRARKTNNLKDRLSLTIDQGTLVLIEASVFNQNGFSIYGARVIIEEVLADGKTKKVGSGYSSRDGDVLFRFEERPARYRITASVKDIEASKEIEVENAAIYRTAITLTLPLRKKKR
jgi:hypothetical protein